MLISENINMLHNILLISRIFEKKVVPFVDFYKEEIDYYNKIVHDILLKEIHLILPNLPKNRKEKRDIIT